MLYIINDSVHEYLYQPFSVFYIFFLISYNLVFRTRTILSNFTDLRNVVLFFTKNITQVAYVKILLVLTPRDWCIYKKKISSCTQYVNSQKFFLLFCILQFMFLLKSKQNLVCLKKSRFNFLLLTYKYLNVDFN